MYFIHGTCQFGLDTLPVLSPMWVRTSPGGGAKLDVSKQRSPWIPPRVCSALELDPGARSRAPSWWVTLHRAAVLTQATPRVPATPHKTHRDLTGHSSPLSPHFPCCPLARLLWSHSPPACSSEAQRRSCLRAFAFALSAPWDTAPQIIGSLI